MEIMLRTSKLRISDLTCNVLSKVVKFINTLILITVSLLVSGVTAYAASSDGELTDLFTVEATRGSLKWLSQFNIIGLGLNWIISAFCILVIFFIIFQKIITISYFVLREFWDGVDEVKKENMGSSFFGMKGYWDGTFNAKRGSGLDAIFNLIYIFLPNVKEMSEMGSRRSSKLSDDDTLVTWFIKTIAPTVFGILLLSMGFNGSLMKCYGVIVDGLGTVADNVATIQADTFIQNLIDSGDDYKFGFDISGTDLGEIQQTSAESIYKQVVYKNDYITDDQRTAEVKNRIGASIESWVGANVNLGTIQRCLQKTAGDSFTLKAEDLYGVKVDVEVSTTQITEGSVLSQPISTFVSGKQGFVNLQFKVKTTKIGNYMQLGTNGTDKKEK